MPNAQHKEAAWLGRTIPITIEIPYAARFGSGSFRSRFD
jgi:hypothetical protein